MVQLEELDVSGCRQLMDVSPLAYCTCLRKLVMWQVRVDGCVWERERAQERARGTTTDRETERKREKERERACVCVCAGEKKRVLWATARACVSLSCGRCGWMSATERQRASERGRERAKESVCVSVWKRERGVRENEREREVLSLTYLCSSSPCGMCEWMRVWEGERER